MSVEKIISDWKKKLFKPVYWLEGEEDYFIDKIVHYAEHNILTESEAGFNLTVFYGRDADWTQVINACKRYPMFAERQVVLLKEAQHMRDIDKLESYIAQPLSSTIFVVSYKEKRSTAVHNWPNCLKRRPSCLLPRKCTIAHCLSGLMSWLKEKAIPFRRKAYCYWLIISGMISAASIMKLIKCW